MKPWLLLSVGSLLLYGCAEVKYVKAGATEADLEADQVDCHTQILMTPSGGDLAQAQMSSSGAPGMATQSASQAERRVRQCLQSKGWVLETEGK